MAIVERLPTLTDDELAILKGNAERLAQTGTVKERATAGGGAP